MSKGVAVENSERGREELSEIGSGGERYHVDPPPIRVLLVGGDSDQTGSLGRLLEARGYDVAEAATSLEAIARLQDETAPLDSVVVVGATVSGSKAEIVEVIAELFPTVRVVVT